jgi:hypothetical protein
MERRKQQAEDVKAARAKVETTQPEDTTMLDSLLEKLRAGDSVKGRTRKRPGAKERAARPTPPPLATLQESGENGDAGDLARGMLAALMSGGFGPDTTITPIPMATPMSPTKRRARIKSDPLLAEELANLGLIKSPLRDGDEVELEESEADAPASEEAT